MIELRNVSKTYRVGGQEVTALRDVSLEVRRGEWLCILGPSGSGKSTLLNLMGCLDFPTSGEVWFDGVPVSGLSDAELCALRRDKMGFVFQFFNLLPTFTAEENVALPYTIAGRHMNEVRPRVTAMLQAVGLETRRNHRPDEMSGGELQRIAVARATILEPVAVLADEPTGNLDSVNGDLVIHLLKQISRNTTSSLVLATHNTALAEMADSVVMLKDGKLQSWTRVESSEMTHPVQSKRG